MINWYEEATNRRIGGKNIVEILTYDNWPRKFKIDPCDLGQVVNRGHEWELFKPTNNAAPFSAGPLYQRTERIIRFDGEIKKSEFETLLVIIGLDDDPRYSNTATNRKDYVVVYKEAINPWKDRFLTQIRTIDPLALFYYFEAIEEIDIKHALLPKQIIPMGELLWHFIEQEQAKWGISRIKGSKRLEGTFGGGERLRFGILIEDDGEPTVRMWSDSFELRK